MTEARIPAKKKINSAPPGTGSTGQPKPGSHQGPRMSFAKTFHDFGEVKVGSQVTTAYHFTNTGNEDLVIELASGCDCSTIKAPEGKAFKPNESGEIFVTFDSNREHERGELTKTIDLLLAHTDPATGYQVIKELKYRVVMVE